MDGFEMEVEPLDLSDFLNVLDERKIKFKCIVFGA